MPVLLRHTERCACASPKDKACLHPHDWRLASLALMLVAVIKVFLFDAAGLDGLARIASFAALGFRLIGVGWHYSRYLPDARR